MLFGTICVAPREFATRKPSTKYPSLLMQQRVLLIMILLFGLENLGAPKPYTW